MASSESNSMRKWASHLDTQISPNAVKFMKVSLFGEIRTGNLEEVEKISELLFALERTEVDAGKSHDYILSRFIYTLKLEGWGHIAIRSLESYGLSVPPIFDDTCQSPEFKLYQCLAEVYECILRNQFCEKHIIAFCSAKLKENPKTITDFYSLLDHMLKHNYLTVDNQTILIEALEACHYFQCANIIQHFREAIGKKRIPIDLQALQRDVMAFRDRCGTCGKKLSTELSGVRYKVNEGGEMETRPFSVVYSRERKESRNSDRSISVICVTNSSTEANLEINAPDSTTSGHDSVLTNDNGGNPTPRRKIWSYKGHLNSKLKIIVSLSAVTATVVVIFLLAGILFATSHEHNKMKEKELYFSGETVIISEVNHFFTDNITVTEDASNVGDSEHLIHLYHFPMNCDSLPITYTYEEHPLDSTLELPNTITYLVEGSRINVNICALSNTTTERTELLLLNNLSAAKSPITESTTYIDFEFFSTGNDDKWICGNYSYDISTTSYYILSFLQPECDVTYNYTLSLNKSVIDLNSTAFISNCSLRYDEDSCSFSIPISSKSSCIVANIVKGNIENRRFIHGITDLHSRQGNTTAGIVVSFIIVIIVLVIILTVLGVKLFL